MGFQGYITPSEDDQVSQSGLYFVDLSGCTISLLEDLVKEDQDDYTECFNYLYKKAQINLKIDLQRKLADRFHIDKKLVTRETSETKPDFNSGPGLAGVKIDCTLPKYGRIQVLTLSVFAEEVSPMPTGTFYIYQDNAEGELLATITSELEAGRNVIDVYQDFEVDTLFIVFDTDAVSLRETKNKYFSDCITYTEQVCNYPCAGDSVSVQQINGGGINVKFVAYCSMEKVLLENLPLFQYALLYRIGVDTMKERITTQRVNVTSVLTEERAIELMTIHNDDYKAALDAATMNIKMTEDPICFMCKSTVKSVTNLP